MKKNITGGKKWNISVSKVTEISDAIFFSARLLKWRYPMLGARIHNYPPFKNIQLDIRDEWGEKLTRDRVGGKVIDPEEKYCQYRVERGR